ncbi:ATP adenylyltransferase-domain-containing protein [Umbelopsis sp. PMI_123]|nr:ATP adenylyltransferase-domain-containing protein [Umbelopsis sp. PMI_123]
MAGRLETEIEEKYNAALQNGNLLFFKTETETKSEGGIEFQITHAPSLLSKPKAEDVKYGVGNVNPFENPTPELHVTDLKDHRLLLNKFCVVPHHLLIVTKEFKKQTDPLLPTDLRATWEVLSQLPQPSIAFYNCGELSGASQPHKHIQIVQLTKAAFSPPINSVYERIPGRKAGEIYTINTLPYIHVIVPLDLNFIDATSDMDLVEEYLGQMFFGLLDSMIQQLRENDSNMTFSYNFILTRQYMMMVPRQKEHWEVAEKGIKLSVNSMAFAGLLLTKTPEELETLKQTNIIDLLCAVGVRRNEGVASSIQDDA